MRNTVIPAQITTVEDKIAGNLNLSQILLLMSSVFMTSLVYCLVPPVMELNLIKVIVIGISVIVCGVLAIRIKGRVVLNWLMVWLKFKIRPNYYVFNKNDSYLRQIETADKITNKAKIVKKLPTKYTEKPFIEVDTVKLLHVINSRKNSLSLVFNQKGGLHVAVEPVKK